MANNYNIVFLFSGQGSHYRGMGQKLFEQNDVFRESLLQSDQLFKRKLGRSLITELYESKEEPFDELLITHPAIVAIEIAMTQLLADKNIVPDCVMGTSLGEFAAAFAAGIWTMENAIEAAMEQAKSIIRNDLDNGGMLTIIEADKSKLENLYKADNLFLATDNFENHFTLSGLATNLDTFQLALKEQKIPFLRLPIKYPFHSPLIQKAQADYEYYDSMIYPLNPPKVRFISGVYGKEIKALPEKYFWEAISKYNNFSDGLKAIGNNTTAPNLFIDVGPSGTSATFVKYNSGKTSTSTSIPIMSPFKREMQQLEKLTKSL